MLSKFLQSGGISAVLQLIAIGFGLLGVCLILWRDRFLTLRGSKLGLAAILAWPWAIALLGWTVGFWLMQGMLSEAATPQIAEKFRAIVLSNLNQLWIAPVLFTAFVVSVFVIARRGQGRTGARVSHSMILGAMLFFSITNNSARASGPTTSGEDHSSDWPRGKPSGSHVQLGPIPIPLWLLDQQHKQTPLKGRCEIVPAGGSNITVPCTNIELALWDQDGRLIQMTRAQNGRFSFNHLPTKGYEIVVVSKIYGIRKPATVEPQKEFVLTLVKKK